MTEAIELKGHTDGVNLSEECGDLEWYLALIRDVLGLDEGEQSDEYTNKCNPSLIQVPRIVELAGDLVDALKRIIFYGDAKSYWRLPPMVREMEFCLLDIYFHEGTNRDVVRKKNIAKLAKRYPDKFTEEDAVNRDLVAERKALESSIAAERSSEPVDASVSSHNRPCCPICTSRAVRPSSMNEGRHICNNCGNTF